MVENCVRVPCVYVIDRLDVSGVAVKLVVTIKAVGLTWMKVENSALLGVGQEFNFSKLTLSNSCSAWGKFVLLLQLFSLCVKIQVILLCSFFFF